ncbi:MAG: hypothetical protein ABH883_00030 [Candidatus Omnitrophota bacterium]
MKNTVLLFTALLVLCLSPYSRGEDKAAYTPAEKEVISYMIRLDRVIAAEESLALVSPEISESVWEQGVHYLSETYQMPPDDIILLMKNYSFGQPLPEGYKKPVMPAPENKKEIESEFNGLIRKNGGKQ